MPKLFGIAFTFLLLLSVFATMAQEDPEICSPEYISDRADSAVVQYQEARAEATDMQAALAELDAFQTELARIQDTCANIVSDTAETESLGTGTMQDPYAFGTAGDTGEGFTIQVNRVIRPADQIIRNANMFNDEAGENEVYIILEVTIMCDDNATSRCETNFFDYELVGDQNIIYEPGFVVLDDMLEVGLFPGGSGTGSLPFLVRADDTNLKLLYKPNIFGDEVVVYDAMPAPGSGVEITATTNINVRSGPGTSFGIAGNLQANVATEAFGRNEDSSWLQISTGWVFTELVTTSGNIEALPVVSP